MRTGSDLEIEIAAIAVTAPLIALRPEQLALLFEAIKPPVDSVPARIYAALPNKKSRLVKPA